MTVNIEYETERKLDFDYEQVINSVVETACDYVKCPYEAEVSVTLTDNGTIQEINKEFRQIDNPTDVLSFPLLDYDIPGDFSFLDGNDDSEMIISEYFNPDSGELMLGDIIISLDKVMEQAENFKKYADVSSDAPGPAKAKIYQYAPSTSAVLKVAEELAPYGTKKN